MRRITLAAIFLSVAIPTFPRLIVIARHAVELAALSRDERRERVLGDFYRAETKIQSQASPAEPLAIIARGYGELADALFLNSDLYPHPTRIFPFRGAYAAADPMTRPKLLVSVRGRPHLASYAEIRDEDLHEGRVVRDVRLPLAARREFIIPIVSSLDGAPPAAYAVEGAIAAENEAHVVLTLQPAGVSRELTVRGELSFYDLVYQCFGRMDLGWVRVTSDEPIRAAFWFVNRTPPTAEPIRLVAGPLARPMRFPAVPNSRLWLINVSDAPVVAQVDARRGVVPPRALISTDPGTIVRGPLYAFLSREEGNRRTRFIWPEDVP